MHKYKVYFSPRIMGEADFFDKGFDTIEEARAALRAITEYTLFLHECSLMTDWSNMGFICEYDYDEEEYLMLDEVEE